ncbi:MAG: carboxypeptidase-like regulatory domain-containing protein [Eudoraea sp.]|nr:carboxypeptidase-like regulatory domain-containing protein [Eudoraea sp.]
MAFRIIFLIFLFFLFALNANAQSIQGKILDQETEAGVPYATIQVTPAYGTISNEEGSFALKIPEDIKDSLIISSMGYQQKIIPLNAIDQNLIIYLDPATIELDEVLLLNRMPTAEEIVRKVRASFPANYVNTDQKYQMFFRGTSYMNFDNLDATIKKASMVSKKQVAKASKGLDSLTEAIMRSRLIEFEDYNGHILMKDKDSSKLAIDKATKLIDSKKDFSIENVQKKTQNIILQYLDTTSTYKLKSGLFKIEDSLALKEDDFVNDKKNEYSNDRIKSEVLNVLNGSQFYESSFLDEILNLDAYRFTLDGASYFQGNSIYVVSFGPRRAKAKYKGTLYISATDYAILKADYSFSEGKEGKKFNMKLLLGIKYIQNIQQGTVLFKPRQDGKYHPYYIKQERGNYIYLHRPLKFIENSNDRNKVVFDFTIEGRAREKKELLILSTNSLDQQEFVDFKEQSTIPYTLLKQFEPSIWQNNQIIEPLEEMKNFKVAN